MISEPNTVAIIITVRMVTEIGPFVDRRPNAIPGALVKRLILFDVESTDRILQRDVLFEIVLQR